MKTIIAGSRNITDYDVVAYGCSVIPWRITEVVSGCARGADYLGLEWAQEFDLPVRKFPANWNKYGKAAGYYRNREMAKYAKACIVFWDGESKGSKHMIDIAIETGLYLKVFYVDAY
jgi:hypothetical protein